MSLLEKIFKKDSSEVEVSSEVQVEEVEGEQLSLFDLEPENDFDEIQTTFNTDDIDELGGEIVEGKEPEIDDLPDVDEEE